MDETTKDPLSNKSWPIAPFQTNQAERKRTVREVAREIATEQEVREVEFTDGVPDDER